MDNSEAIEAVAAERGLSPHSDRFPACHGGDERNLSAMHSRHELGDAVALIDEVTQGFGRS